MAENDEIRAEFAVCRGLTSSRSESAPSDMPMSVLFAIRVHFLHFSLACQSRATEQQVSFSVRRSLELMLDFRQSVNGQSHGQRQCPCQDQSTSFYCSGHPTWGGWGLYLSSHSFKKIKCFSCVRDHISLAHLLCSSILSEWMNIG